MTEFLAHRYRDSSDPSKDRDELLEKHLRDVANLAATFAARFDSADWGHLAGLWHDLGKYKPEFQRRVRGESIRVEHSDLGAVLALSKEVERGMPLAFVIAAHHAGLPNSRSQGASKLTPLYARLKDKKQLLDRLRPVIPDHLLHAELPPFPSAVQACATKEQFRRRELWIRFLFSALIDADSLQAERFTDRRKADKRSRFDAIETLQSRFDDRLDTFCAERADPDPASLNASRGKVLLACREAATQTPGVFSLTVPTGGAKTLSAMSFALNHIVRHPTCFDPGRVIAIIPYTSIIEQNAAVYKKHLGNDNVIEHHSSYDAAGATDTDESLEVRRQLACENWDAPIIVTTSVQFFESLFANRRSRCRKLHNIAGSVIILDEVQTLPPQYLACILDVLQTLVDDYHCTLILSTATPPAIALRERFQQGLRDIREIIPDPIRLGKRLERVDIHWPIREAKPVEYPVIADDIRKLDQALVIVHRRDDARRLAEMLPKHGRFHLSALMCAAHRSKRLDEIKEALDAGNTCRLVATQLVEAGVDLDFPVVYRALAGLDSIAQAAGRCNRENKLPKRGQVHVFEAETRPPPGALRRGQEVTRQLLAKHGKKLDLTDPTIFDEYFRLFYAATDQDAHGVQPEREKLNFANVARLVRLVEDEHHIPIVVPYGDGAARIDAYRSSPERETLRALQRYTVNATQGQIRFLQDESALDWIDESVLSLATTRADLYDEEFGLKTAM